MAANNCHGSWETLYSWGIDRLPTGDNKSATGTVVILFQMYPHGKVTVTESDTVRTGHAFWVYIY